MSVWINLQLFAEGGEKTEKASSKKRQDARKKGQVLKSKELETSIVLLIIFLAIKILGSTIYGELSNFTKKVLVSYTKEKDLYNINSIFKLFYEILMVVLKTVGPLVGAALVVGLIVNYSQVGFLFTTSTLAFKFSRINPATGLKRVFSLRGIVELVKSILKICIVGYIAYAYISGEKDNIAGLMNANITDAAIYMVDTCIEVAIRICVAMIILSILDYIYQWWQYEKDLKMSKEEVKQEYKQTEGNPEIKGRIKQKQRQISMRRMLSEVPNADVIITNPTHFAVALKYDTKKADAPVVIAKGQDFIALRIKEVGKENNIEIVENKPLARSLFNTCEVGKSIPPELYQAVAEVLAFVYSLKGDAM
jgi:flagellar biosynthesis protein FlhB